MAIFTIHPETSEPTLIYQFDNINPDQSISDLTYSSSGKYLYRSGSNGLYKTDMDTYQHQVLNTPIDWKDFEKIRVTNKEDVYVASTKDNHLYISKTKSGAQSN